MATNTWNEVRFIICLAEPLIESANETVLIAHRMLDPDSPIELMDDVELFSLTQFNNPVTFSAAGVFKMNRGLITKTAAAALSYLIIAVQLSSVSLSGSSASSVTTSSAAPAPSDLSTVPLM